MILVDANLLIYATNTFATQYAEARHWLDRQLLGAPRVGLPWTVLLGFLRLSTNRRIVTRPLNMSAAWNQVEEWMACDPVRIPRPGEKHAEVLGRLLAEPGIHGNLVTDAHVAALAIEHGLTLYSTDGDFARFPGLKWQNPLARR